MNHQSISGSGQGVQPIPPKSFLLKLKDSAYKHTNIQAYVKRRQTA